MKEYILFIDTETSGMPIRWDRPLTDKNNWPCAVQVAWVVFDRDGREIRRNSKYIYEKDIAISAESVKIHGITEEFLRENGSGRKEVLRKLAHDIRKYDPMIVAHFLELDLQVLGADYLRAQLNIPFVQQPLFCTMLKSKDYVLNPSVGYLRLPQLYKHLFKEKPQEIHNAERDAELTASCFFELRKRGEILAADFEKQQKHLVAKLSFPTRQFYNPDF